MDDIKKKFRSKSQQGKFPWWAWAIILAGGLSALVGWLLRRRAVQEKALQIEGRPSPRLLIAQTPIEAVAPVVQEIPLPVQRTPWPSQQAKAVVSEPAAIRQASPADDLTVIEGIGPVIANTLKQAGIDTFALLAETEVTRLQEILHNANLRLGDPTTWPEQAKLISKGDWDGFHALTNQLKGGRRIS